MHAQVIVNESWSSAFGSPSEVGWSSSEVGENGNIYTVGHEQAGNRIQFLLSSHDSDGNLLWASSLETSSLSVSFGTAIILDGQGNIYCAGAAAGPGTNGYDLLVAKFDTSGDESWHILVDGPEELDDYGVALLGVDAENLVVAGLSSSSESGRDILAVMANDEGDVVWQAYYDYAQKDDAPVGIEIFDGSTVEILGASQDAGGDWDILSWRLPTDDGEPGSDYRYPFLKLDYEKGLYCEKDSQGNYYFSGTKTSEAGGLDMQAIKLDASFELEWAKEMDGGFGDDAVFSMAYAPGQAAVYLGGYSANRQGGQDMYVASFSSAGDLLLEYRRVNNQPDSKAAARAVRLAADGDVYAAGEAQAGGEKELVVTRFDKEAGQLWEINAGLAANPERQSFSLLAGGQGRLLFSGAVQEAESKKYVLKAWEELDLDREVVFSEDSIPHYVKGEIIIRFASPVLDSSFIDNTNLHYGPLCEVVTDTALLGEMGQLLELPQGEDICDCHLIKVFPRLTTEELCITTLDGDPLYIPPYWTTMVLKNCTTGKNELAVSAGLDSISAGRIVYAHPNFVGAGDADCEDPLCEEQHSLWDTPNPDYPEEASINILPAWDHSTGKPETKVGVFDSGIFYQHEDFGYGSVVEESWSFLGGNVTTISDDPLSHGTRGAGIIGAIRGNDLGIAGIAGGDTGAPGVTLLGFQVLNTQNLWNTDDYAEALMFSIQENGSPMIGLANNSLSVPNDGSSANDIGLLEEAVNLAFRAGIALIASRGNGSDGGDLTQTQYPCSFNDEITICVGSTGTNGELKDGENGDPTYPGPGDDGYASMYGEPMDLLAPGSGGLIHTTTNVDQGYGGHTGTSAAAPHATGVAALLASASGQVRLSVEDLEHIMQYTADDLEEPFYDQRTGWGRLNAGAALEFIQENRILHFSSEPDVVEYWCDHSLPNSTCGIEMQGNYLYDGSGYAINTGDQFFRIDVVRHTWDISLDVCALTNDPNAIIVDSAEKPGYWVRNSASPLWGEPEDLLPPPDPPDLGYYGVRPYAMVRFETPPTVDGCVFQGQLSGYSYAIYDEMGQKLLGTMPAGLAHCESPRLAISLLVQSENPVPVSEERVGQLRLFPNPTTEGLTLDGLAAGYLNVQLFSINGQNLGQLFNGHYDGKSPLSLRLPDVPPGLYFCRARSGQENFSIKLVKQ